MCVQRWDRDVARLADSRGNTEGGIRVTSALIHTVSCCVPVRMKTGLLTLLWILHRISSSVRGVLPELLQVLHNKWNACQWNRCKILNYMYAIAKTPNMMVNALANLFVRTVFSCPSLLSCRPGSAVADCIETYKRQLKQLFLNMTQQSH